MAHQGFSIFNRVKLHLTLKIASAQVVETLVANNSPSEDSKHSDGHFQVMYVTPGFKYIFNSIGLYVLTGTWLIDLDSVCVATLSSLGYLFKSFRR